MFLHFFFLCQFFGYKGTSTKRQKIQCDLQLMAAIGNVMKEVAGSVLRTRDTQQKKEKNPKTLADQAIAKSRD